MASALDRVRAAEAAFASGFPSVAVSAAYYAVLYAARAALSEEDSFAKTHRGIWGQFGEHFVATGRFDPDLAGAAHRIQELREATDYDARDIPAEEASTIIADAARFLEAVTRLLGT